MSARILIIDDEATIRASLLEALANEGYTTESAETGEEALAKCHGQEFDLVVTDLKLPGVSGLEILQALRNQGRQTPVIMMTAYTSIETAVDAIKAGAFDYVAKPFDMEFAFHDEAEKMKVWDEVERAYQERRVVTGRVIERVKGGLAVDIGVRAFLPGSQVDMRPVRNLDALRGQELRMRARRGQRPLRFVCCERRRRKPQEPARPQNRTNSAHLRSSRVSAREVRSLVAVSDRGRITGTWISRCSTLDAVSIL